MVIPSGLLTVGNRYVAMYAMDSTIRAFPYQSRLLFALFVTMPVYSSRLIVLKTEQKRKIVFIPGFTVFKIPIRNG